jgi:outer membrane protein
VTGSNFKYRLFAVADCLAGPRDRIVVGSMAVHVMRLCLVVLLAVAPTTARAEPITLRAAVDTALRHHPLLDRVTADDASAVARIGRTRAAWLPTVSATGSFRNDYVDPVDAMESKIAGFGNDTVYNIGLNVQQLITDFGLTEHQINGARAVERQARRQVAVSRLDVELAVVQAYLDVLQSKDLLAVSTGAIALVNEQLARATALFKATLRPEIDVLSAKTQLAQAQLSRLRDDNGVATSRVLLENAIGVRDLHAPDALPVEIRPLEDEGRSIAELTEWALRQRPELGALRDGIAAAEATVLVGRTRTSPVVRVEGGVYATGGSSDHSPPSQAWTPGVGAFASLSVSMDFYTGGANRYEIKDAEAQVRSARAELERVEQAITLSVSRAALTVRISRNAFATAIGWREQAERQLQLARTRYQSDVGNFVELNDARTGLVNARRQEVQARYDLAQSRITLARELGRGPAELAAQP